MNKTTTYREATALETKFYWQKVDKLEEMRVLAMGTKHHDLISRFYVEKENTYKILSQIGYRVDQTGLYMREEDDILNMPYDQSVDQAVMLDYEQAMKAMRTGTSK